MYSKFPTRPSHGQATWGMIKKSGSLDDALAAEAARIQSASEPLAERIAQMFHERLLRNLELNKFGFSLKDSTIAARVRRGNTDKTPLIDTGEYVDAIIREGATVKVKDGTHKSGMSYTELSWILEHGRRDLSVAAFPVWERTYEELLPEIEKLVEEFIGDYVP